MSSVVPDVAELNSIALLLSASEILPHRLHSNRAKRFCYILPIDDPTMVISAQAFRTDGPVIPNVDGLSPTPLVGETYVVNGKSYRVCTFIAYSLFRGTALLSTHCEPVMSCVPYVVDLKDRLRVVNFKGMSLIGGNIVSVVDNVIDFASKRRK